MDEGEGSESVIEPLYVGDGVYLSFDGHHIILAANHHENYVIALNRDVWQQVVNYGKRLGWLP